MTSKERHSTLAYCTVDGRDKQVLKYLGQGERALLERNFCGIDFFEKASELDPCNPQVFYRQGLALFEYGSAEKKEKALLLASKKFKNSLQLDPGFFEAWHAWGNTLALLGQMTGEYHYVVEAEERIKKASEVSQGKSDELLAELAWDLGKITIQIGEHSGEATDLQRGLEAFESCTKYQQQMPHEFWNDYGLACLAMFEQVSNVRLIIKAIHCFKHAVSITLSSYEGWLYLAQSLYKLYLQTQDEDHFTQAHECFSTAANLRPHTIEIWQKWALFLLESGERTRDLKKLRACIEKCKRGCALNTQATKLLAIWAEALAILGSTTDTIDLLYEAQNKLAEAQTFAEEEDIELTHSEGKILFSWGLYFHDFEYFYQAIEKFQEMISFDRTRHQDWFAIAKVYARIGEFDDDIDAFEKALRFYAKAVDLKPCSLYYFEYGLALSHLGEMKRDIDLLKQAVSYFEYTLQVQKKALYVHPEWLFHYAITLDLLGDVEEEETYYQKALEIFGQVLMVDPDFPRIHYRIGLVYSHLGELVGEVDHFYRALHHYRLALKHEEDDEFIILDWGVVLIHIAEHTFDKESAEDCFREAELKLIQASRLGNEQAFYQLACLYSLLKHYDNALTFLQKSYEAKSLPSLDELLDDEWLDNLRVTTSFQKFITQLQHG